jgi:hypothetical protein
MAVNSPCVITFKTLSLRAPHVVLQPITTLYHTIGKMYGSERRGTNAWLTWRRFGVKNGMRNNGIYSSGRRVRSVYVVVMKKS